MNYSILYHKHQIMTIQNFQCEKGDNTIKKKMKRVCDLLLTQQIVQVLISLSFFPHEGTTNSIHLPKSCKTFCRVKKRKGKNNVYMLCAKHQKEEPTPPKK